MNDYHVVHNPNESRFELEVEGQLAVLDYTIRGNTILFIHTGVPPAIEGRGIGTALVKTGLDYAHEHHYQVVPYCWFVSSFIERYPKYQDLLKDPG
ncbi:MAG TPA: GNAT family N-acetyltransferase [Anaerolineaceae bacterium]|nr:GNAT family N-acetyltransferase [Anaerolineaceae bacterium]